MSAAVATTSATRVNVTRHHAALGIGIGIGIASLSGCAAARVTGAGARLAARNFTSIRVACGVPTMMRALEIRSGAPGKGMVR